MTNGPPAAESPAEDIQERVEETARRATPWIAWTARAGYVAKGVIYAAVGILAARVALGASGKTTGTGGAVESIGEQPFGKVLLLLLAAGLLGYAFWKLVQGVMDPSKARAPLSTSGRPRSWPSPLAGGSWGWRGWAWSRSASTSSTRASPPGSGPS